MFKLKFSIYTSNHTNLKFTIQWIFTRQIYSGAAFESRSRILTAPPVAPVINWPLIIID